MSASSHDSDPQKLALTYKPSTDTDLDYHRKEWTSGTRGGGKVPKDFHWRTNPKQTQEENGAGNAETPISK